MKSPNFVAIQTNGQWACAYVGDDAGKAKETYTAAVNANESVAYLFVRPDFTRRFKPDINPAEAPEAKPEAPEAKPKKGGK